MQHSNHSIETQTPVSDPDTYSAVVLHLSEQLREWVMIDPGVEDYPLLLTEVHPNREVLVLHPQEDGIQPIPNRLTAFLRALQGSQPDHTVHLVSHAAPGILYWGNWSLSSPTLQSRSHSAIQQWHHALTDHAGIIHSTSYVVLLLLLLTGVLTSAHASAT